jgi:hypothetical protein
MLAVDWTSRIESNPQGLITEDECEHLCTWLLHSMPIAGALLMSGIPGKPRSFGVVHVEWRLPWAFGIITDHRRATDA